MRRVLSSLALLLLLETGASADATGTFTLGGPERDQGWAIATDGEGGVFVAGSFKGTLDFDPGPAVIDRTAGDDGAPRSRTRGRLDAFVAKYDKEGKIAGLIVVGGSGVNLARALAVDDRGGFAIGGQFSGTVDLDPSDPPDPADTLTTDVGRNAYIARYDADGTFRWAIGIGDDDIAPRGSSELAVEWSEGIRDVAIGPDGRVYAAGMFRGRIDLDPGEETVSRASIDGSRDAFLVCYDDDGRYVWDTIVGGAGTDQGHAVALGPGGTVALGGVFEETVDFDGGHEEMLRSSAGGWDVFVAAYRGDGELRSVWTWGGKGSDQLGSAALAFDAQGGVYAAGHFTGHIDFDPGRKRVMKKADGASDAFVVRYDAKGKLDWALTFGGGGPDRALALSRDRSGHVVVGGRFGGRVDFDPSGGRRIVESSAAGGASDAFVASYTTKGKIRWALAIGAEVSGPRNITSAVGLARGKGDAMLAVGTYFGCPELGTKRDAFSLPNAGSSDVFVVRLDAKGEVVP